MAFDPIAEGATEVTQGFDPIAEGATLVQSPAPAPEDIPGLQNTRPPTQSDLGVDTFLGKMPNLAIPQVRQQAMPLPTESDIQKAGLIGLGAINPEIPAGLGLVSKYPGLANAFAKIGAGSAYGAISTNPGDKNAFGLLPSGRIGGAIEGAGLGSIAALAQPSIGMIKTAYNALRYPEMSSEEYAQQLMKNISNDERPEEAGKNLSSQIQNVFNNTVKPNAQAKYDEVFNSIDKNGNRIGNNQIYNNPDPIRGIERQGQYIDSAGEEKNPYGNPSLDNLHNNLLNNPTLDNAHKLQSELGFQQGRLDKQYNLGNLDSQGEQKLFNITDNRKALLNDMGSALNNINPNLNDAFKAATKNWKNEVIPYTSDTVLNKIVQGKLNNPTTSDIVSTFKNPEPAITKVANDLGSEANNRIAYIGMNKLPEENTPENMLAARSHLEKRGLNSYLNPLNQQSFDELTTKMQPKSSNSILNMIKKHGPGALSGILVGKGL